MSGFADELEASARGRYVRWDSELWRALLEGPARKLGESLSQTGASPADAEELLRAYLRLGAEAIGLGYLYPATAGRQNLFTLAWTDLVPRLLSGVPEAQRAGVLAQLWNVGENLESAPPWVQRIFYRVSQRLGSLTGIEERLRETAALAMEPPAMKLGDKAQPFLVDLSREDSRFLPGPLHFLAPTVLCVHDRHRHAIAGREAATQGLLLSDTPIPLGAMGCRETPEVTLQQSPHLSTVAWRDARVDSWFATVTNDWRAAGTLDTSQHVVVLVPV
ncbi:hypothetical protein HUA74_28740 [Myxococcus sp. CA051A]|uniref:hypothetical protein n=1 Tax=unclassified Myxococcus TaxID=2648731 RepID=UPI00157A6031|nr:MULTISPECIES: hypothetical protein [unclassified Myxococcus]NTX05556.1 hypothetical protein [Myxococcus sp. CA040A]NTX37616.1 hypothetical protein [Myxococcus sp. CA033]NTX64643.1 hypothetical protein [Myxococcus sp. CA051A]